MKVWKAYDESFGGVRLRVLECIRVWRATMRVWEAYDENFESVRMRVWEYIRVLEGYNGKFGRHTLESSGECIRVCLCA